MYETHEQGAQLLAVEGVLLLCNVHFNLSGGNVIQQHSDQLQQEPGRRQRGQTAFALINSTTCRTQEDKQRGFLNQL